MYLVQAFAARLRESRKRAERGATVVMVTLLMVALLGMAAISVDFALASNDKAQAQNAADAAALAVARQCAVQATECNTAAGSSEVTWAIAQNAPGKSGSMTPAAPAFSNRRVSVTVTGTRESFFARAAGWASGGQGYQVGAKSTATWDEYPVAGEVPFPVGIGYCDWLLYKRGVGDANKIRLFEFGNLTSGSDILSPGSDRSCDFVSPDPGVGTQRLRNNPDTMAWMLNDFLGLKFFGQCRFESSLLMVYADWFSAGDWKPACNSKGRALRRGQVILVPIYGIGDLSIRLPFTSIIMTFPNSLTVLGFAPFEINRFRTWNLFAGGESWSQNECRLNLPIGVFGHRCFGIEGQFIRTARPLEGWTYGTHYGGVVAPDLGAVKVQLTE